MATKTKKGEPREIAFTFGQRVQEEERGFLHWLSENYLFIGFFILHSFVALSVLDK